ncbi:MAG: hypothetical protein PVI30_28150 [Myxococcales bacterium]|jgi:hypothetical protein
MRWPRIGPSLVLALLSACALDAGSGFATLGEGELQVELSPGPARDLGDGRLLTDLGYEVTLERAELEVDAVRLSELSGGGGGGDVSFDPANPPPGYSLCHGGHCHADDGSLPSYEEVQAALAGGEAQLQTLVSVSLRRTLSLLPGETVALADYEPSRELPEGSLDRLDVALTGLSLRGDVRGPGLSGPVELRVSLALQEVLGEPLAISLDRDGPAILTPRVGIRLDGSLFDGLDFAALRENDGVAIDDPDSAAATRLLESLFDSDLRVEL